MPAHTPAPIIVRENDFAVHTMSERWPDMLTNVIESNEYPPLIRTELEQLRGDLEHGKRIQPLRYPNGDDAVWQAAYADQQQRFDPLTWYNCEWFFAETYLYRQIAEITRWYELGHDPFAPQKQQELDSERFSDYLHSILHPHGDFATQFSALLKASLWGNRVDLSHSSSRDDAPVQGEELVIDARSEVAALLEGRGAGTIHLLADNAGTEFAADLVLLDWLLGQGYRAVIHIKAYPLFISDVLANDFWDTLWAFEQLGGDAAALERRLNQAWDEERLRLQPHPFWNSPLFLWDMPSMLRDQLNAADLIILKGDANYRRALGDTIWPVDLPIRAVIDYLDAPLVALRALKSDLLVGLSAEKAAALDQADSEWRTNGKRGMVQFKA